ncbi:hypothetical protein DC498_06965 [Terrimonas sp.]|uniref:hypothetical protein n=1 Tax=Terrimonas sp. TaxID=1914338 RepID=UPI000D52266A|nr:hypothetical protein [Terrimonas sp.]PVD53097.1 hypothetical protein DC498_06965 [Terrimonas sp.]
MGLDSVEILMKVENTFGIKIPDHEAEKIITIGDFHNAVWKHLSGKDSEGCRSQTLFYRLRKGFQDYFNVPYSEILLNTSPENIFPEEKRREHYYDFAISTGLALPQLVLTRPWANFLNTTGFLFIAGGAVTSNMLIFFYNQSKWLLLIPVAGICTTILLSYSLNSKRTRIPLKTLRAFTEQTLMLNFAAMHSDEGANRKEMEFVINHIISDMAGVDIEEITPGKKIADDLGID